MGSSEQCTDRTIITIGDTETVKIRKLDAMVTEMELTEAVAKEGGCEPHEVQVVRMFKYPWEEGAAILRLKTETVEKLREVALQRVGFTSAKVITTPQRK